MLFQMEKELKDTVSTDHFILCIFNENRWLDCLLLNNFPAMYLNIKKISFLERCLGFSPDSNYLTAKAA